MHISSFKLHSFNVKLTGCFYSTIYLLNLGLIPPPSKRPCIETQYGRLGTNGSPSECNTPSSKGQSFLFDSPKFNLTGSVRYKRGSENHKQRFIFIVLSCLIKLFIKDKFDKIFIIN